MSSQNSTNKFKCFLVCQTSTRKVLLPHNINYLNLVNYCRQKFSISVDVKISLSYEICSEVIDVNDDEDVESFVCDFSHVTDQIPKLFIKLHEVKTYSSCKSADFDLNKPYIPDASSQNNPNKMFTHMPDPPIAPVIDIKDSYRCNLENRVPCTIRIGDRFTDKADCIIAIATKAIIEGFEFYVIKSCSKRYSVRCAVPECSWNIYTRKFADCNNFRVTSLHPSHTCEKTQLLPNHRNASKVIIGHMIMEKLRNNRRVYTGTDIKTDFKIEWKIDISYLRAWTGKNYALKLLYGSHADSFSILPKYCYNLKLANPGTVTHIETDAEGQFKMCFVGFGVSVSIINELYQIYIS